MIKSKRRQKIIYRITATAIVSFWVAFIAVITVNFTEKRAYPLLFEEEITVAAEKYGIAPELVFAIVRTESGFEPLAVSVKGAVGLMQILPSTGQYIAEKKGIKEYDLYDININLDFGVYYWQYLSEKFSGLNETAAAYNAGEGTVKGWLKNSDYSKDGKRLDVIPYKETCNYVKKISESLKRYKKLYGKLLDK